MSKVDKNAPKLLRYFHKSAKCSKENRDQNNPNITVIDFNKDELNAIVSSIISQNDKQLLKVTLGFKEILCLLKNTLMVNPKEKEIIDPLYLLTSYVHHYHNPNLDKIIFSYALIYNDKQEYQKCAYVLLKYLFPKDEPNLSFESFMSNFYNLDNFTYLLENTFELINSNMVKLITDENLFNSIVLLFNSLVMINCSYIKRIYHLILKNQKILVDNITSPKHFSNLVKVLCKMNETLIKNCSNDIEKDFELNVNMNSYGNKIKILLYWILFNSNLANTNTSLDFIFNHLTEISILQAKWLKTCRVEKVYKQMFNLVKFDQLCTEIVNHVEIELRKDKHLDLKRSYLNILGKIYNIYYNFYHPDWTVIAEKIFDFFKEHKVVTVDTLVIKINLFRDMLNDYYKTMPNGRLDHKQYGNILTYIDDIRVFLDCIKLINQNEVQYYMGIMSFLVNVLEIMLRNIITRLSCQEDYEQLREIVHGVECIWLGRNETNTTVLNLMAYVSVLKSLNEDVKVFTSKLEHLLSLNDDNKKIIPLGGLIVQLRMPEKLSVFCLLVSKEKGMKVYFSLYEAMLCNLRNQQFDLFIFSLDNFARVCENVLTSSDYEKIDPVNKENLFRNMSKAAFFIFNRVICEFDTEIKAKNELKCYELCNTYLSYLRELYTVIEKINEIFSTLSNTFIRLDFHFGIVLDYLYFLNTDCGEKNIIFAIIKKLYLERNILENIITNKKHLVVIHSILEEIIGTSEIELSHSILDKAILLEFNKPRKKPKGFYEFINDMEWTYKINFALDLSNNSVQLDKVSNRIDMIAYLKRVSFLTNFDKLKGNSNSTRAKELSDCIKDYRWPCKVFAMLPFDNVVSSTGEVFSAYLDSLAGLDYSKYYYHQMETCFFMQEMLNYALKYSLNLHSWPEVNAKVNEIQTYLNKKEQTKCSLNFIEYVLNINILFYRLHELYSRTNWEDFKELTTFIRRGVKFLEKATYIYVNMRSKHNIFREFAYYNIRQMNNLIKGEIPIEREVKVYKTSSYMNYHTILFDVLDKIKRSSQMLFKYLYKFNIFDKFHRVCSKLSEVPPLLHDNYFLSVQCRYILKFLRKWPSKLMYIHREKDIKSIGHYSKLSVKLLDMYIKARYNESIGDYTYFMTQFKSNISKEVLVQTWDMFIKEIKSKVRITEDKFLFHFLSCLLHQIGNKEYNLISDEFQIKASKDKRLYMKYLLQLEYSDQILTEELHKVYPIAQENITEFILMSIWDINNRSQVSFYIRIYYKEISNSIYSNEEYYIQQFTIFLGEKNLKRYKHAKRIITDIITIYVKSNHNPEKWLFFYIENILNYKIFLFSQRNKIRHMQSYIGIFRLKDMIFCAIRYRDNLSYNLINRSEMLPVINSFSALFLNHTNTYEKHEMESILFALQRLFFGWGRNLDVVKLIYMENPKYKKHMQRIYDTSHKIQKEYDFNSFLECITESLIRYDPAKGKSYEKFNSQCEEFFLVKKFSKRSTGTEAFTEMYDEENIIHLITGNDLYNLPIESIPILSKLGILRVANYNFVNEGSVEITLTHEEVCYLLNPGGDLVNCERLILPEFEKLKFKGIKRREPPYEEMWDMLKESKLFLYCGHGDATKYVDINRIKKDKVNFISFIMGCSSAKIPNMVNKDNETLGVISYYQLSQCPMFVGCLWDVTDRDIDNFSLQVIKKLFIHKSTNSILEAILSSKKVCTQRYLNGSSFIVSGSNVKVKII